MREPRMNDPDLKPWLLQCCGCRGIMTTEGEAIQGDAAGWPELLAYFTTQVEADQFAKAHGWSTRDIDGPNHRCPNCQTQPVPGFPGLLYDIPRGAYVRVEDLFRGKT